MASPTHIDRTKARSVIHAGALEAWSPTRSRICTGRWRSIVAGLTEESNWRSGRMGFSMKLQPRLLADLARLTTALDSSTVDLAQLVDRLSSDIDAAVSAVISIALTVVVDGEYFKVLASTGGTADRVPASSLRLTLADPHDTGAEKHLLILSGIPGSLVDFAADVKYSLGLGGDSIELDRHLPGSGEPGSLEPDTHALAAVSEMNQAIGVLIAGGRSATEGRAELHRLAAKSGTPTAEIARRTLRDARGWFPPPGH